MPIYEFICEQCGQKFEVIVGIRQRGDVKCPDCGGSVRRSWEGSCAFGNMKYSGGDQSKPCEDCPCRRGH